MADYEGAVTGLIPCSVVLLTAADGDRRDAMTATTVFVAEEPPVLTMSVAKHILMHDLIETSREFVVNLASSEQASLAKKLGATHGRDVDKFAEFSLVSRPAAVVRAPILEGSFASLECQVIDSFSVDSYSVYHARVVAHAFAASTSYARFLPGHRAGLHALAPVVGTHRL